MKIEFKEEQKFRQWWLWIILIGIGLISAYRIYKQLIMDNEFGNKTNSDIGFIFQGVFILGLIAFFWIIRLKTEIDESEIRMNLFPLAKKKVSWKDIKSAKVVNYGFVGGWGIRLWTKYGTVYNTKGNKGLAIELHNGKKFLIGTQKDTELNEIVQKVNEQQRI